MGTVILPWVSSQATTLARSNSGLVSVRHRHREVGVPGARVRRRGPARPGDPPHLRQQHPVLAWDERGEGGERRTAAGPGGGHRLPVHQRPDDWEQGDAWAERGTVVHPPWDL
ncbi:hypothetical protein [Streptomyces sp. NPDC058701]|uniref:hypothetical protein n=1 Tax=Streptomyces sp. NPDC058701 TaxID=3346608 RepID=UPI0036657210